MIPRFDLDDFLPFFSWGLLVLVACVGLLTGWTVVRAPSVREAAARKLIIGLPFFLTLALYRAIIDHTEHWESWLGIGFFFTIYAAGCVMGFWLRRTLGHGLTR